MIVGIDTETTSFSPSDGGLVEVAAYILSEEGHEVATFSALCNPGVPIPAGAREAHGICDGMVVKAPPAPEVVWEMREFLIRHADGAQWWAHNAQFDARFLGWNNLECSLALARASLPGLGNHKLGTVARYLGAPAPTHRALSDARAVAHIVRLLTCDLQGLNIGDAISQSLFE